VATFICKWLRLWNPIVVKSNCLIVWNTINILFFSDFTKREINTAQIHMTITNRKKTHHRPKISWFTVPVQSVPSTTKDASSNPVHGEVYSIQHYVIKIVSDLRQVNLSVFKPLHASWLVKTHKQLKEKNWPH
jgi:hypothetical protein